jgi:hypothetical protein
MVEVEWMSIQAEPDDDVRPGVILFGADPVIACSIWLFK